MKNKIKNSKDLAEEIRKVRLKKEVTKQKLISDARIFRHKISSIEAGFEIARSIVGVFKGIKGNQIPPGEKIRNMAINTILDILSNFMSRSSGNAEGESSTHNPSDTRKDQGENPST